MSPGNEEEQKEFLKAPEEKFSLSHSNITSNPVHKSQISNQNIYVPLPIAEKSFERPKRESSVNVNF